MKECGGADYGGGDVKMVAEVLVVKVMEVMTA